MLIKIQYTSWKLLNKCWFLFDSQSHDPFPSSTFGGERWSGIPVTKQATEWYECRKIWVHEFTTGKKGWRRKQSCQTAILEFRNDCVEIPKRPCQNKNDCLGNPKEAFWNLEMIIPEKMTYGGKYLELPFFLKCFLSGTRGVVSPPCQKGKTSVSNCFSQRMCLRTIDVNFHGR